MGDYTVKTYDSNGRLLLSSLEKEDSPFSISSDGVYFANIRSNTQLLQNEEVVIKK
jgi:hypothetical protein